MEQNEMLNKLVDGLCRIFEESINSIILYGSAARGTATSESDVDVAVIVSVYTDEMRDAMLDMLVDLELEYNKVLSVQLIDVDKYTKWNHVMPYYKNIKREGVCLWKAA